MGVLLAAVLSLSEAQPAPTAFLDWDASDDSAAYAEDPWDDEGEEALV